MALYDPVVEAQDRIRPAMTDCMRDFVTTATNQYKRMWGLRHGTIKPTGTCAAMTFDQITSTMSPEALGAYAGAMTALKALLEGLGVTGLPTP
jgi:hypothetical protein